MKTSKKSLAVAALVFGAALMTVVPRVGVDAAKASDLRTMFHIEFRTRPAWNGDIEISGYVENKSGHAVEHVRLVVSELNSKGHVISRVYRTVDDTIPVDSRAYFDVEVPSAPSYRVSVDSVALPQAP